MSEAPQIARQNSLHKPDGHDCQNVDLNMAPYEEKLNSLSKDQLVNFLKTKGQNIKQHMSENIVRQTNHLNQVMESLQEMDKRTQQREAKLEDIAQQRVKMEEQNVRIAAKVEELKKVIAEKEGEVTKGEEDLVKFSSQRLTCEHKFDEPFVKKLNKYFDKNSEMCVVNITKIFVGLLRNDDDVTRIDIELIFKTYSSLRNKFKSAQP
jgi:cell pole-organizing protein PopZ